MTGRGLGGPPSSVGRSRKKSQGVPGAPEDPTTPPEGSSSDVERNRQEKRLRINEGLLQRVRKVQRQQQQLRQQQSHQQQQQQQQQNGLLLVGEAEGGKEQQQQKLQQMQKQQQLFAKLVALRVSMNPVLHLVNKLPAAAALQQQRQQQGKQQQEQHKTSETLAAVKRDAARLFVLLQELQQQLLQQSALAAAYTAAAADSNAAAAALPAGGGWEQRRESYEQQQQQQRPGGEADVWRLVGDRIYAAGLRAACLANADAWHHQTCANRSRSFSVFNRAVSVQLIEAMQQEEEKLLANSLLPGAFQGDGKEGGGAPLVYGDLDFYVELLKASVASGDVEVDSAELIKGKELLKNRSREKSKAVDRRASKGRKIRYKPIPQLESFMAPEPWAPNTAAFPGANDPLLIEGLMNNLFAG